jgi:hypothetical protein
MKTVLAIVVATLALSGCVVTDPYYVQPAPVYVQPRPVYVQPRPVYVQPRPVYVAPPVRCTYVQQWNGYTRQYQPVRICR